MTQLKDLKVGDTVTFERTVTVLATIDSDGDVKVCTPNGSSDYLFGSHVENGSLKVTKVDRPFALGDRVLTTTRLAAPVRTIIGLAGDQAWLEWTSCGAVERGTYSLSQLIAA